MIYVDLLVNYFVWHYSLAVFNLLNLSKKFLFLVEDFFSMGLLFRTFFSPWRRLSEKKKPGLDLGNIFSVMVVNSLMRVVGVLFRSIVLFFGFLSVFFSLVFIILVFIIWLLWPAIIIFLFLYGIFLIIN